MIDRYTSFPLSLRPSQYERIMVAARKVGQRYSQFIREAALEKAEKVEREQQENPGNTATETK